MPAASTVTLSIQVLDFKDMAFSSSVNVSFAVSVRRASALPAASFRSYLTVDTLAVQLTLPPVGCVEDLHLQVLSAEFQRTTFYALGLVSIGMQFNLHRPDPHKPCVSGKLTGRLEFDYLPFELGMFKGQLAII